MKGKQEKILRFQRAVDEDLLEEAALPVQRRKGWSLPEAWNALFGTSCGCSAGWEPGEDRCRIPVFGKWIGLRRNWTGRGE